MWQNLFENNDLIFLQILPSKYSKKHNSRKGYKQNSHEYPTSKRVFSRNVLLLEAFILRLFFLEVFLQKGNQCLGILPIISMKNNCGLRMGKKK